VVGSQEMREGLPRVVHLYPDDFKRETSEYSWRNKAEGQEAFYGREVITATREMVELESDEMVRNADTVDVAFLVVGDPLG
jgi:diphthamide biosynthesis methyltransferase